MISRWHFDVIRHTCKALLPFQEELRRLKRRAFPYKTDNAMDRGLLQDGLQTVRALREAGAPIEESVVLEIGSGWHPVVPLLFHMAGARRVMMADQVRLMDLSLLVSALKFVEQNGQQLTSHGLRLPHAGPAQEVDDSATFDDALESLGLEYLAPFDIAGILDQSVGIIVSRAVLEHIPPKVLTQLFAECRRVLKPNGYLCHLVDNTDHYAHGDRSINFVNFLKFEDWQWRLLTIDPLSYTNRLRHSDYRRLFQESGFKVVKEETKVDNRSREALKTMHLATGFRDRESEDLAIATSLFVATVQ